MVYNYYFIKKCLRTNFNLDFLITGKVSRTLNKQKKVEFGTRRITSGRMFTSIEVPLQAHHLLAITNKQDNYIEMK